MGERHTRGSAADSARSAAPGSAAAFGSEAAERRPPGPSALDASATDLDESETILRLPPPPVSAELALPSFLDTPAPSFGSGRLGAPAPAPGGPGPAGARGALATDDAEDGSDLASADSVDEVEAASARARAGESGAPGDVSDDAARASDDDGEEDEDAGEPTSADGGDEAEDAEDAGADADDADDADADEAEAEAEAEEDGEHGSGADSSEAGPDDEEADDEDAAGDGVAASPPAAGRRGSPRPDPASRGGGERSGAAAARAPAARRGAGTSDPATVLASLFPEPPSRSAAEDKGASASEERLRASSRDDAEPEPHEILFGELARLEGFASSEQVAEALRIQQQLELRGRKKRIGKIMVKLRYMTATQAKYVLRLQRQKDPIEGYKLLERRGQGGMGVVYRAVQKSLKREVAVKILSPRYAAERRFLQRFFQEAKLSAELNHTNVVSAIDFGESNGYYYYAMEYVDGWSVSEMLKDDGPFDAEEALDIVLQIARGLDHASRKHIVHRDIKPENILVTPDGVAKLTDLGLSKQLTSDCSLTAEGKTLGTPFYVSPELARGTRNVDTRSDIYSLGATLYHMLAGEPPFTGDNAAAIMACHIAEEPPPLRKKAPHASKVVQRLVERMMDKDPERRYQTADDLARDIAAILKGRNPFTGEKRPALPEAPSGRLPAGKRPVTGPRRAYADPRDRRPPAAPPPRRGRGGLVAGLVGGALAIVAVVVVLSQLGDSTQAASRGTGDGAEMPLAERERLAAGRLAAARPGVRDALERGLYDDAFKLAREALAVAEGTAIGVEAAALVREVEERARPAAHLTLRNAEAALKDGKADLALEYLAEVPQVDDPAIRARMDDLRTAARQLAGGRR